MYFALTDEHPIAAGPLVLRPVEADDAEPIWRLYEDPVVLAALGRDTAPTLQGTRSLIGRIRDSWGSLLDGRVRLMFAVTLDGERIGFTEVQLGYAPGGGSLVGELTIVLTPGRRGQGLGRIALRTFIDSMFQRFRLMAEVWGECVPDNAASIRLMEVVGMEDCGEVLSREDRLVRKFRLARPPGPRA